MGRPRYAVILVLGAALISACSSGPSKGQALEAIQQQIKEDGSCTLPVDVLSKLKPQHASKGICVPLEGADKAKACLDALVAASVTRPMPPNYMAQWTDETAAMPAYEHRARNLTFKTCVEMTAELRDGRFVCGEAHADEVVKIKKLDDARAEVHYTRTVTTKATLEAIEKACGTVSHPAPEATVTFVKGASSASTGWTLSLPPPAETAAP